jgi:hypothetical protein
MKFTNKKKQLSMKQTIKNILKMISNLNLITLFNNLLKKIFSIMVQNCKNFYIISVHLKKFFFAKNINIPIMALFSLLYLGTLLVSFMYLFNYTLIDMFQLIIMALITFAVSIFISDNFKFSNNKFIFFLQKSLAKSLYIALIVLILLVCWVLFFFYSEWI